jgi:type I site-specific restriction-modification system R (restriction) subunit
LARTKKVNNGANLGFEAKLWAAADALRNNMDAAEYKHVLLGLIFLKYISDAFEAKHAQLLSEKAEGTDPEDSDEYRAAAPHKNLAVEVLRKLINGEIKRRAKKNVVQSRSFAELLERSIRAYQNRAIDALGVNDSAVEVLGDETLMTIARELVTTVRGNVTIDWTLKETVRARLRVMVKRVLRKYGYPPDKQEQASQTVLEQAEVLCADWAA